MDSATIERDIHIKIVEKAKRIPKLILRCAFGWPGTNHPLNSFFWIAFNGLSCGICTGQLIFINQNKENFGYIFGVLSTFFISVFMVLKMSMIQWHKTRILRMVDIVKYEFWPLNSAEKSPEICRQIFFEIHVFAAFYISCFLTTYLWVIFPYIKLEGHKELPILSRWPFDADQSPIYEITYTVIVLIGTVNINGVVGYDMLFGFFIQMTSAQFKLLKAKIKSINNIDTEPYNDDKIYKELIWCINHHIKLIRFSHEIKKTYEFMLAVSLSMSAFIFIVLGFLLKTERNVVKLTKVICYLVCMATELFIYCLYGSQLRTESGSLAFAVYESGWWKASPKVRRAMVLMIQTSQRELELTAMGFTVICKITLIDVIRLAFSVVTLISHLERM